MEILGVLAGVVVGGLLSIGGQWMLHRQQRRDAAAEWLRTNRWPRYVDFLEAANECTHRLRLATWEPGRPVPDDETRAEAGHVFDARFMPRVWAVKLYGSPEVAAAAEAMIDPLKDFRNWVVKGEVREYESRAYNEQYAPFLTARNAFIETAKRERGSDLPDS